MEKQTKKKNMKRLKRKGLGLFFYKLGENIKIEIQEKQIDDLAKF